MHLDSATIQNLELVRPMGTSTVHGRKRDSTLLAVLDRTTTAMGSRLLREWILRPLVDPRLIRMRLDSVAELKERSDARVGMRSTLRAVQDICRLGSRISLGVATPREILALKESVAVLPELVRHLETLASPLLADFKQSWDNAQDIYDLIEQALLPEAPLSCREGGLIKDGHDAGVDELRKAGREGKGWITALEARERQRTGIESLKIRYNQIFGYYIEVTKTNLSKVPNDYVRKQTLVNAERFMTAELRDLEAQVTGAESKLNRLEYELFEHLQTQLLRETQRLQKISESLATLDVLASLSETAALNHYVRPTVDDSGMIVIKEGRHPVVERLDPHDGFVPNDTRLDLNGERLLILTGPNMAGKSTYLRQVALITLLAQIGSFVPAKEAHIGLVDRIFTRVGASDNLSAGQSTFMVEMTETAQILNCATNKSLILLDEIGRGTSTYDGLSIAWAVAEYIHNPERLGARTLFATHYHEMTELETLREGVRNYRVAVQERDGDVVFLRKIVPGGADRSYGIHVAKLAGLPREVILRAQEVLLRLEEPSNRPVEVLAIQETLKSDGSLPRPHPLLEEVRQMNLFSMTPLDALNTLADIQRRLESAQDSSAT
jgi:DNA mismatch repair protein MutS